MSLSKVAITLDSDVLARLDGLVARRIYPNSSKAIQDAVADKLSRFERARLAEECTGLDPAEEQAMAEEGVGL